MTGNSRLTGTRGLRRYTHRDYAMVASWYEARGQRVPSPAALSDLGYIADERVCGFLYLTNSNIAMLENVVASPYTVPSLRKESLTKLMGYMIDTALVLGYDNIFGISKHPSLEKEAKRFNFKTMSDSFKVYVMSEEDAPVNTTEVDDSVHVAGYDSDDEDY